MVGAFSDNGVEDSDTSTTSDFCLREDACDRDREREMLIFGWLTLGMTLLGRQLLNYLVEQEIPNDCGKPF